MKEELIEARGRVVKLLPNASFRVMLENGSEMIAYTSGKVRKNKIRILAGDEVLVQITPYDPDRGRVVLRYKKDIAKAADQGSSSAD